MIAIGIGCRKGAACALQIVSHQTATVSRHSYEATGVSSVSEAAALAGAGSGARLLLGRITGDGVTCAIAVGDQK